MVSGTASFNDILVSVDVIATVIDNAVAEIVSTGSSKAYAAHRHDDAYDALEGVRELLDVAGIELPEDWPDSPEPDIDTTVAGGTRVEVWLGGDQYHEFDVHIRAGSNRSAIVNSYDDSAWVGGSREGMHIVPPYELLSDTGGIRFADGGWRAISAVLEAIADRESQHDLEDG